MIITNHAKLTKRDKLVFDPIDIALSVSDMMYVNVKKVAVCDTVDCQYSEMVLC